jgi:uncharacterized membrane protein YfhO
MLDFIWHGLHFPDSLPGRQSFLYIFLLLVIGFEAIWHIKGNRLWHVAAATAVDAVFWLAAWYFTGEDMRDAEAFVVTAVLLVCYALLLMFYFAGKERIRKLMVWLGAVVMMAELVYNFDATGLGTVNRTSYTEAWEDYENVLAVAKEQAEEDGVLFYRTEELERKTKNDAALLGYQSATQFSSLMNIDVSHFYQKMGLEGGKNFYCYNGATPLLSAMLSVRYVIADNDLEENPFRTLVAQSGDTYLYENKYVLPIGFVMPEDAAETWSMKSEADVANQNELAGLLGAESDMLKPVASVSEVGESTITVEEDGYIFATYKSTTVDDLVEIVGENYMRWFTKASHNYILELGYWEAGTEISIANTDDETVEISAYCLDLDSFAAAFETLNENTLELDAVTDTKVSGHITLEEPGRLIFSIAKEDGWTLSVDGVETEPELFGEAFISVPLQPGTHEVTLTYHTPGFGTGLAITLVCAALFAVTMLLRHKKQVTDSE